MNLNKLIEVLHLIQDKINEYKVIKNYEKLIELCKNYDIDKSEETKKEIEFCRKHIATFHSEFVSKIWTEAQLDVISKLNKDGIIGKPAIKQLNQLFLDNSNNYSEISKNLLPVIPRIKSLLKETSLLLNGLDPIVEENSDNNKKNGIEDNNLLIISFEENTFIQNIILLEKFCRIWNKILMSFMYLTNENIKTVTIHDISTNSVTFFIEDNETVSTITKASYEVLKGYKKVIEIRRLQLEIDSINLSNKLEIKDLLEDEVVNIVDIISSQVTYELISKFGWDDKTRKNELHKNIQISLKQIVNFIEKGGRVESKASKELHVLNEKIIMILKNIKELEGNNSKFKEYMYDISFDEDEEDVERFD